MEKTRRERVKIDHLYRGIKLDGEKKGYLRTKRRGWFSLSEGEENA